MYSWGHNIIFQAATVMYLLANGMSQLYCDKTVYEFRDGWSYFVIALQMSKTSSTNETKKYSTFDSSTNIYNGLLKTNGISNIDYSIVLRLNLGVEEGSFKIQSMLTEGRGQVNANLRT